jgi:hypothetical protein
MSRLPVIVLVLAVSLSWTAPLASAQEPPAPWREDALFKRLATELDAVPAIDNHTHLRGRNVFNPDFDAFSPVLLRSTNPWLPSVLKARFGVAPTPGDWKQTNAQLDKAREEMIARLTQDGYWRDHLDYTRTDIALVNTNQQDRTDGRRFRWVPHASVFLYPVAAPHLMERSPSHDADIAEAQKDLHRFLAEANLKTVPSDLPGYVKFVDDTLSRWQTEGAVAVKFWEAYLRTLRIADVPEQRAAVLYARGQKEALAREEYIELQDFLWRHILLKAAELSLPVHIHSSLGAAISCQGPPP